MTQFLFDFRYKAPYGKRFLPCDRSKYKCFNSEEKAIAWAVKYYGEWSEEYSRIYSDSVFHDSLSEYVSYSASKDPIRFYCGYESEKVNNYMRGISLPDVDPSEFNDVLVTLLLFAPRIPENIVVYRYVPEVVIEAILQKNKEDSAYIDKGFMSCSLLFDPPNHDYFDYNHILEIYVDRQTVGVYTNLIKGCRRSEFELLLLRNAKMYLIDYPYVRGDRQIYPMRLKNVVNESIQELF